MSFFAKNILNKLEFLSGTRISIYIFSMSIFVGGLSAFHYYNESPTGDATYYYNAATLIDESLSNLFNSPRIGVVESFNAIIQGLTFGLPGNHFQNVYFVQIIIFSLTGLFIFKLAHKFIGKLGGLITFAFYLINNKQWGLIYNFKPGVWINFFLILVIYYTYLTFQNPEKRKYYFFVAVFSALLLLTDLRYLPHILFLYFLFFFLRTNFIEKMKSIVFSSLILVLIISPWILRQSLVFNKFIFISDVNTVTIHHAFNTKYYKSLSDYTKSLANLSEDEYQNQFFSLCKSLHLTPGELIYARAEAKKTILNTPPAKLERKYSDLIANKILTVDEIMSIIKKEEKRPYWIKLLKRAVQLWAPFKLKYTYDPLSTYKTFYPPASLYNNINRLITLGILMPFLLVGLYLVIKEKDLFGLCLGGVLGIHTIVHVLTYVQWRYMLPVMPLITIISIYALLKIIDRNKDGNLSHYKTLLPLI